MRQHTPEMDPMSPEHEAFAEATAGGDATLELRRSEPTVTEKIMSEVNKAVGAEGEARVPDEVIQVKANVSMLNMAMKIAKDKRNDVTYRPLYKALEDILREYLERNGVDASVYKSIEETEREMLNG